jgi:mono/diheme cytochrome c family protein
MKIFKTVIFLVIIMIVSTTGLIYSGYINVGANVQDNALSNWLLTTAMQKSVKHHAQKLTTSVPELGDHSLIIIGAENYDAMCADCHIPPGRPISPLAKGLNPTPPDLRKSSVNMTTKELFWVTKNGVRMTGMPAWGLTHSDDEIWSVVAFIKTLPNLGPDEYKKMVDLAKRKGSHMQPDHKPSHSGHSH